MGILEVKNVSKRFGGLQALGDVNLSVEENTVHAIIGPNGAGKSTLLNCFIGKLMPDTGSVMFDGHSLLGIKPHEINQLGVSRVFQTPEIFSDLSVFENVMIACFAKRDGAFRMHAFVSVNDEHDIRDKAEQMLIDVNMQDKKDVHAASLSRGDKRRLEMAMCLAQDPKLLLLDEPTAGLDPIGAAAFDKLIRRLRDALGLTVFLVTHDLDTLHAVCDRIAVLAEKRVIVVGTMEDMLREDHAWVREYFTGPRARAALDAGTKTKMTTGEP